MFVAKKRSLSVITIVVIVIAVYCSASELASTITPRRTPENIQDITIANPIKVSTIDTVTIDLDGNDHTFQIYQVDDYEISIPFNWSFSQVRELELKTGPEKGSAGELIGIRSNPGGEGCILICHKTATNEAMTVIMKEYLKPNGIDVLKVEYNRRINKASSGWIEWYWVVSFMGKYEGNDVQGDYLITDLLRDSLFKSYSFLIIKPIRVNTDNTQFEKLVDFILSSFKPISQYY